MLHIIFASYWYRIGIYYRLLQGSSTAVVQVLGVGRRNLGLNQGVSSLRTFQFFPFQPRREAETCWADLMQPDAG